MVKALIGILLIFALTGCSSRSAAIGAKEAKTGQATTATSQTGEEVSSKQQDRSPEAIKPPIVAKPIMWDAKRQQLMKKYALAHYGEELTSIVPQAVVVHWTASDSFTSAYNWFYNSERPAPYQGTLNVSSQFLVDRQGTIYQLQPEAALARHSIGYNWCTIGIENVGGTNSREDLTEAQLQANIKLIAYLAAKYPTIKYVWGHYQQELAKESGLYKELEQGYFSAKVDPGPIFMEGLRKALEAPTLKFYPTRLEG